MDKHNVFVSYSHVDLKYLNQLKRHFNTFKKRITFWDDGEILVGQVWRHEIEKALEVSKIAILLISADFFNSQFINNFELLKLLSDAELKGTKILSLIVKPCLFGEYSEINKYQALNSPSKTLIQMSEAEQEETFVKLVLLVKQNLLL